MTIEARAQCRYARIASACVYLRRSKKMQYYKSDTTNNMQPIELCANNGAAGNMNH